MHRCWLINPAERPRFSEIVSEIARYSPLMVRCRSGEKQQSHSRETTALPIVDLHDGDLVAVIEGRYFEREKKIGINLLYHVKDFIFDEYVRIEIIMVIQVGLLLVDWTKSTNI